jgi:hypothetical protein
MKIKICGIEVLQSRITICVKSLNANHLAAALHNKFIK